MQAIAKVLTYTVGVLIALVGLALLVAYLGVAPPRGGRQAEDIVESLAIFSFGAWVVAGARWPTHMVRWLAIANVFFWFGAYGCVFYGRRIFQGQSPTTYATIFTIGMVICACVTAFIAFRRPIAKT